jgi:hypothetical protein
MKYRFVEGRNVLTQPGDVRIPANYYAGLTLHYRGTVHRDTFDDINEALADLGTILVRHRGRNIVNATARAIYCYDELAGGYSRAIITAGEEVDSIDIFLLIPFRYGEMPGGNDDNLLNAGPDELHLTLPAPLTVADWLTLTCNVGSVTALGVPRYIVQISTQNTLPTLNHPVRLQIPNMRRLLIDTLNITTAADSIQFLRGANEVIFEGPQIDLEAMSDLQWYREAADLFAVMVECGRDDMASYVGGKYDLRLIGAVSARGVEVTEFGALPVTPAEFSAGRAVMTSNMQAQFQASPEPPSATVAPADPTTPSSGQIEKPVFDLASRVVNEKPYQSPGGAPGVVMPGYAVASPRKVKVGL